MRQIDNLLCSDSKNKWTNKLFHRGSEVSNIVDYRHNCKKYGNDATHYFMSYNIQVVRISVLAWEYEYMLHRNDW